MKQCFVDVANCCSTGSKPRKKSWKYSLNDLYDSVLVKKALLILKKISFLVSRAAWILSNKDKTVFITPSTTDLVDHKYLCGVPRRMKEDIKRLVLQNTLVYLRKTTVFIQLTAWNIRNNIILMLLLWSCLRRCTLLEAKEVMWRSDVSRPHIDWCFDF